MILLEVDQNEVDAQIAKLQKCRLQIGERYTSKIEVVMWVSFKFTEELICLKIGYPGNYGYSIVKTMIE